MVYPLLKRQNEILSLGYVTARIMECVFILVGILAVLAICHAVGTTQALTPPHSARPLNRSPRSRTGRSCSDQDWSGIGNGLILGYLMYRSGLMPPRLAMLGLIGGPLLILSGIVALFDVIETQAPCRASPRFPSSSGNSRSASSRSYGDSGRLLEFSQRTKTHTVPSPDHDQGFTRTPQLGIAKFHARWCPTV